MGEQVMIAQTVLRDGGYYKAAIDGDFGGKTEAAVRAFQLGQQEPHAIIFDLA
jgi:peptidoglycan hydrolase-like protein with peptidoglycan-binding domain